MARSAQGAGPDSTVSRCPVSTSTVLWTLRSGRKKGAHSGDASTVQAWISLIKDHSKWNGAAPVRYAGAPNAPGLADFEKRVARALDKP